jgi:DNA mismatch repair protein MutL
MASVSDFSVITKTENSISGLKIDIKGGKMLSEEKIGCRKGTTIIIKDIFFNTPARKKYLKSIESELSAITDIITRYALIYPEIHFKFTHDSKIILEYPSVQDELSNISYIYGKEVSRNLIKIEHQNVFKITGYISKPSLTRSTKSMQSIYVNKRYVKKNSAISNAVQDAYHGSLMTNRYPIVILKIEIDAEKTDVNVHPQKAEIRIQDEKELYKDVYDAVKNALGKSDLIPNALTEKKINDFSFEDSYLDASQQKLLIKETAELKTKKLENIKILGIINKTYIIAEIPGNIILIDQHAAAERILYEEFTKQLKNKKIITQELLNPEVLELSSKQFLSVKSNIDKLKELGFSAEEFGPNSILIRTIPVLLGRHFDKDIFLDFADELNNGKSKSLEDFFHEKIARMSCRKAIKAGDIIELSEIKRYVEKIFSDNFPSTCPHGRPIVIKWSFYELEKMFKRVV